MKKITTFLGCVGVVCLISGCSSDSDDLEKIVLPSQPTANVASSSNSNSSISSATAATSNSSNSGTSNPTSSGNQSTDSPSDTVHKEVVIKSEPDDYPDPYFSSGVFCWSEECEKEWAGKSSASAPKSSSSMTIDIGMSVEAPVPPVVTETQMIDARDQSVYNLIRIGTTHWMASDLTYATADGSVCYESSDANCKTYGRLYTFAAAQKACPTGWRLPNRAEAQAAIEATNMPWSFSGRCSGSDCKYADGMGFHWTAAAQQDGDKMNVDQCSGSTAVIIVEKNPDSDYAAEPANFFQVDCQAKLFSVRCVEGE